jgi:hypothetical protein
VVIIQEEVMMNKFDSKLVRVGIVALTLVASTQAFARGEGGGGGGGGGGEGGAGEIAFAVAPPTHPDTPDNPPPSRVGRSRPTLQINLNCQLWQRSLRYC